jgi:hypothetical protein
VAAGSVEGFLIVLLIDVDMDRDKVLLKDRLVFGRLDKPIEFLAPPSPGGVKDGEDGAMISCGQSRSFVQDRGGRGCLRLDHDSGE